MNGGLAPGAWLALAVLAVIVAIVVGWRVGVRHSRRATSAVDAVAVDAPAVALTDATGAVGATAATDPAADASGAADGTTLGPYRIERRIGSGSMGAVFLGRDGEHGAAVAIKTLALGREFDGQQLAEARARFFREADTARRLRHPDIVAVHAAGEERGLAYIAMEYVDGHDLQRHTLPGRLLPVPVVLEIAARVALALAYAHTQGVVHRDIKPANVMVDLDAGIVKVADFGIARITDACRTRTGLVLGTPSFMSPEQMAGRRVDGRTDLYSLGVMLYQLLTGALPHPAESMAQLLYEIANEPAPDVRRLRPELPEALANVVALALEKQPELRYADGVQLATDLRAVAATLAAQPAPHAPAAGVNEPPDSGVFEATATFERADPRHNAEL